MGTCCKPGAFPRRPFLVLVPPAPEAPASAGRVPSPDRTSARARIPNPFERPQALNEEVGPIPLQFPLQPSRVRASPFLGLEKSRVANRRQLKSLRRHSPAANGLELWSMEREEA